MFIRLRRKYVVVCIIPGICLAMIFFRGDYDNTDTASRKPLEKPVERSETKKILYWTPWWLKNSKDWFFGVGGGVFKDCPVSNCIIHDRSTKSDVHTYDALIFHSWHLFKTDMQFPMTRSHRQR